ncbi:hypothetical protein QU593_18680 [Rossellomorea marisflavi]|uniref:hypothetical protein n=1 Tax=Rossellomorea marisflavi TaxID=189381 RepID=UPI0006F3239E|nr:hypothetical protein [Rossellomorea marisflavi]KQU63289.1 hypothetical protein ASG66_02420 [Bacillus sp. Leaf406]UKS66130.1 hypothetical protein K6T23_04475 [Rossellomorea marisflavi]WJV18133.1 hypothetical protein QU593_18680 [Rossellomorea marisflavi]
MKRRWIILIVIMMVLLSGCQRSVERKKAQYDPAIKQVLALEKDRIAGEFRLKRENTGIAVYGKGQYLMLYYDPEPDVGAEALYQRNEQGDYDYIPEEDRYDIFDRDEKIFETNDYIENLGIK